MAYYLVRNPHTGAIYIALPSKSDPKTIQKNMENLKLDAAWKDFVGSLAIPKFLEGDAYVLVDIEDNDYFMTFASKDLFHKYDVIGEQPIHYIDLKDSNSLIDAIHMIHSLGTRYEISALNEANTLTYEDNQDMIRVTSSRTIDIGTGQYLLEIEEELILLEKEAYDVLKKCIPDQLEEFELELEGSPIVHKLQMGALKYDGTNLDSVMLLWGPKDCQLGVYNNSLSLSVGEFTEFYCEPGNWVVVAGPIRNVLSDKEYQELISHKVKSLPDSTFASAG